MKHLLASNKSLLVGDEAADLLVQYAALLAQRHSGDTVDLTAIGPDGSTTVVTFLLNSGTDVIAETTHSDTPEPDNTEAEQFLRVRIAGLGQTGVARPEDIAGSAVWNAEHED